MRILIQLIFLVFSVFFLFTLTCNAQPFVELKGKVIDAQNKLPLPNAHIFIRNYNKGVISNESGEYSFSLSPGRIQLQVSYLGYISFEEELLLTENQEFLIELKPSYIIREEIKVQARKKEYNIESTETGTLRLKTSEIKEIPAFLGSPDPIKALQFTPGIQSVNEGNAGIYVRGGTPGHNLIILDHMPLHNPSHLLGIYSVFNPLSVQNITLIKGGIPAQYGGKLSSVIEVQTPSSSEKKINFAGHIGTLATAMSVSGKTQKKKGFFLISARRTHLDLIKSLIIDPLNKKSSRFFRETKYYFNDFYAKYSYILGQKDRLFFQYFFSSDYYNYLDDPFSNRMKWNNWAGALIWNHQANSNFSCRNLVSVSYHSLELKSLFQQYQFLLGSHYRTIRYKLDFFHTLSKHQLKYGAELVYNSTIPERIKVVMPDLEHQDQNKLYSLESYAYLNDNINLSQRLNLSLGVRYSRFMHLGPYTQFNENELGEITEANSFEKNKIIRTYHFFEPRFSLSYLITANNSIKTSYTENSQNFHLAEIGSVSLPADIKIPSTSFLPPEKSRQFSLGYYHNFKNNQFETNAEVYFKQLDKQIELKQSAILKREKSILEDEFYIGKGRAYGLEIFVKKTEGRMTGWIGYTLSRSQKRFDAINQGKYFNTKYDRRHDLSLLINYRKNKKWSYSLAFVFASGNNLTLPVGRYIIQGNIVNDYGQINSYRMPPYHRLDLSAKYQLIKNKRFESFWTFALYNAYSRSNPYYIYFSAKGNLDEYELDVQAKQISLFPILPSVSWNFKF